MPVALHPYLPSLQVNHSRLEELDRSSCVGWGWEMMLRGQGGGGGGRCLFTATQWQELEHQALIFKYIVAGSQVPHELVLPLRSRDGGLAIDTAPSLGWGYYGQYGRRAEDPEPGRCRRTDGKKWRCSREAYGESKYCDKHMHRGKSRSRKPVEATSSSAGTGDGASYRPSPLSISPPTPDAPSYGYQSHLRPEASSARAAAQINPLQLHLDTAATHATPSPPPSYHRYAQAQYCTSSLFPSGYGGYGSREHEDAEARRRQQQQHCLSLGADLSLDKPDPAAASTEKPLRRFFVDDWPRENNSNGQTAPWMDHQQDETQLSISIPTAPPELAIAAAASRFHHHLANE